MEDPKDHQDDGNKDEEELHVSENSNVEISLNDNKEEEADKATGNDVSVEAAEDDAHKASYSSLSSRPGSQSQLAKQRREGSLGEAVTFEDENEVLANSSQPEADTETIEDIKRNVVLVPGFTLPDFGLLLHKDKPRNNTPRSGGRFQSMEDLPVLNVEQSNRNRRRTLEINTMSPTYKRAKLGSSEFDHDQQPHMFEEDDAARRDNIEGNDEEPEPNVNNGTKEDEVDEDALFSRLPNFTPPEISKSPTLSYSQKDDFLSFNLDSIVTGTKRRLNMKAKQLQRTNNEHHQDDESSEEMPSLSQRFLNDSTSTGIDFALSILNEDINKTNDDNHNNDVARGKSKPLPRRLAYQENSSD